MAIKKQRLDKYYSLAKDRGYRARSAFKLLELDRKYRILANTHIAVDLCAAPGGWMQILAQEMPTPRKIIGIDMDPIKHLGADTVSFVGDITTVECRRELVRHLEGHQADIFVHDGAPSFGASKDRDVFVQNDLVLHALRLTTEFLKEGGTFVTKIFRSENFFKITRVLEELFLTVDVTKPLSSRSESAEIFAVCRHFRNPEHIDASLFDSGVLFCDESPERDGNKRMLLSDFIRDVSNKVLADCAKIQVDFQCDLITEEFLEMFKDIKLLHNTDLKKICRLKGKILRGVRNGTYDIPVLSDLFEAGSHEDCDEGIQTVEEKIDEIGKKLRASKKNSLKSLSMVTAARTGFFDDRMFEHFSSTEADVCLEPESVECVPDDSCSDSMEMTESELRCAVMMKEMGDRFVEETIDRNMIDSDDVALPCEKRAVKFCEFNAIPKKRMEFVGRKKARAMRRANKAIEEIEVEDEEEEAVIHKKIFKSMYKKQRNPLRLVFPGKNARLRAPKGRGKIKCLDARMKHDLRIERQRAKRR